MVVTFTFVTVMLVTLTLVTLTLRKYLLLTRYAGTYGSSGPSGNHATPELRPPTNTTSAGAATRRPTPRPRRPTPPPPPHPPAPPAARAPAGPAGEGREAPRPAVDPRPAPRLHPYPAAIAVRRPSHDRGMGCPDGAVVRCVTPFAIVVEIFGADRLARHVLRRAGVVPAAVAGGAPVLPLVRPRRVADVVAGRVATRDDRRVPRVHREGRARGGDVRLAVPHGDGGRIARRIDVHAVGPGLQQRDRAGRRVDLEAVVVPEIDTPT